MKFLCLSMVTVWLSLWANSLAAQAPEAVDTLETDVRWYDPQDSVLVAGAGLSQGVYPGSRGIVCVPFSYRGVTYRNRVASGLVTAVEDSTCRVQVLQTTAPVRPGYRILLYGLKIPSTEVAAAPAGNAGQPFYKRRWFWLVGGACAGAAIIAATHGGSTSSPPTTGTVEIGGNLP